MPTAVKKSRGVEVEAETAALGEISKQVASYTKDASMPLMWHTLASLFAAYMKIATKKDFPSFLAQQLAFLRRREEETQASIQGLQKMLLEIRFKAKTRVRYNLEYGLQAIIAIFQQNTYMDSSIRQKIRESVMVVVQEASEDPISRDAEVELIKDKYQKLAAEICRNLGLLYSPHEEIVQIVDSDDEAAAAHHIVVVDTEDKATSTDINSQTEDEVAEVSTKPDSRRRIDSRGLPATGTKKYTRFSDDDSDDGHSAEPTTTTMRETLIALQQKVYSFMKTEKDPIAKQKLGLLSSRLDADVRNHVDEFLTLSDAYGNLFDSSNTILAEIAHSRADAALVPDARIYHEVNMLIYKHLYKNEPSTDADNSQVLKRCAAILGRAESSSDTAKNTFRGEIGKVLQKTTAKLSYADGYHLVMQALDTTSTRRTILISTPEDRLAAIGGIIHEILTDDIGVEQLAAGKHSRKSSSSSKKKKKNKESGPQLQPEQASGTGLPVSEKKKKKKNKKDPVSAPPPVQEPESSDSDAPRKARRRQIRRKALDSSDDEESAYKPVDAPPQSDSEKKKKKKNDKESALLPVPPQLDRPPGSSDDIPIYAPPMSDSDADDDDEDTRKTVLDEIINFFNNSQDKNIQITSDKLDVYAERLREYKIRLSKWALYSNIAFINAETIDTLCEYLEQERDVFFIDQAYTFSLIYTNCIKLYREWQQKTRKEQMDTARSKQLGETISGFVEHFNQLDFNELEPGSVDWKDLEAAGWDMGKFGDAPLPKVDAKQGKAVHPVKEGFDKNNVFDSIIRSLENKVKEHVASGDEVLHNADYAGDADEAKAGIEGIKNAIIKIKNKMDGIDKVDIKKIDIKAYIDLRTAETIRDYCVKHEATFDIPDVEKLSLISQKITEMTKRISKNTGKTRAAVDTRVAEVYKGIDDLYQKFLSDGAAKKTKAAGKKGKAEDPEWIIIKKANLAAIQKQLQALAPTDEETKKTLAATEELLKYLRYSKKGRDNPVIYAAMERAFLSNRHLLLASTDQISKMFDTIQKTELRLYEKGADLFNAPAAGAAKGKTKNDASLADPQDDQGS